MLLSINSIYRNPLHLCSWRLTSAMTSYSLVDIASAVGTGLAIELLSTLAACSRAFRNERPQSASSSNNCFSSRTSISSIVWGAVALSVFIKDLLSFHRARFTSDRCESWKIKRGSKTSLSRCPFRAHNRCLGGPPVKRISLLHATRATERDDSPCKVCFMKLNKLSTKAVSYEPLSRRRLRRRAALLYPHSPAHRSGQVSLGT